MQLMALQSKGRSSAYLIIDRDYLCSDTRSLIYCGPTANLHAYKQFTIKIAWVTRV